MGKKPRQFYSLKRPKVRASWNLRNLYNLSRLRKQLTIGGKTFFQQKYEAKQLTRAYHGEQIREGKWERMFSRYVPAVVEMDARRLAMQDGAEQAAGRGSGADAAGDEEQKTPVTPYMQMTYWTNERRLDTAIFRSLFASSLRQARQMVVHGHVKVNGKTFLHPSYLLNPGDMYSVNPDIVLFATSNSGVAAQEAAREGRSSTRTKVESDEGEVAADAAAESEVATISENEVSLSSDDLGAEQLEVDDSDDTDPDWSSLPAQPTSMEAEAELEDTDDLPPKRAGPFESLDEAVIKSRRSTLKELYELTRETEESQEPSAKQKQELRVMRDRLRIYVGRPWRLSNDDIDAVAEQLETLLVAIEERGKTNKRAIDEVDEDMIQLEEMDGKRPVLKRPGSDYARKQQARVNEHLVALSQIEGYWEPKDYMAPFAFIPRYLEVNHTVCSGVYLRHPVARMGSAEVPTPFSLETGNLAYSWYLRRR